jgi:peptide/nickel transport system substrate-binding protein
MGEYHLKKSYWLLLSLLLVLSLFLAACGSTEEATSDDSKGDSETKTEDTAKEEEKPKGPQPGGNLIVGSIGEPTTFNPYWSQDTASSDVIGLVFDSLLGANDKAEPVPALADKYETSEDGLTWTFYLKKDLKWTDGNPITAHDVVYSLDIPRQEGYDGPRASSFAPIESLEATDDHTVKIVLKEPNAKFVWTAGGYGILPKHILGDVPVAELGGHEFFRNPTVTSGPFVFKEWKAGEYLQFDRNDSFYKGAPYLDSVIYKIVPDQNALLAQLQAGDIQYMSVPASDYNTVKEWDHIKMSSGLGLNYTYFGFNMRNPLFQDEKVRYALTMAIDREAIVQAVMDGQGEVAHVPTSPLSWSYNADRVTKLDHDIEKAKQYLADAGWSDSDGDGILDKDGKKFAFELKTNQGNKIRDIAVVIQQQLKEVGIEVTPNIMEWSAFIKEITKPNFNFDTVVLGWSLGIDPDPTTIWATDSIENGLNFGGYSNEKVDELIAKQIVELDFEKRQQMLWEIYEHITKDQPYTFLYYPLGHTALPNNLEGYERNPFSGWYEIEKWYYEQK